METQTNTNTRSVDDTLPDHKGPNWWTDKHTSAWERVKDAMKRDWEQTKNDFSGNGRELKQDAGDTVKQAFGSAPIPAPTVRTHPLDEADAKKAREKMDHETVQTAKAIEDAQIEIVDVGVRAHEDVMKAQTRISEAVERRAEATRNWDEVEQEVRYGFGARTQYPSDQIWDDGVENELRGEWNTLAIGRSWDQSRAEIRRGWNSGSEKV